jgi:hypothetical protein
MDLYKPLKKRFFNDEQLLELSLSNRLYIWAKFSSSQIMALLDRFLCIVE